MTFKVGDKVVTRTDDGYSGFIGVVVKTPHGGIDEYRVKGEGFKDKDAIVFGEAELDLYQEDPPGVLDFNVSVQQVVNEVRDTLIAKNKAYGNSALEPVRVFSTADRVEQLRVRIDDKLSRLKPSLNNDNEDTVLDLMGYLVLLRIATRKQDDNG